MIDVDKKKLIDWVDNRISDCISINFSENNYDAGAAHVLDDLKSSIEHGEFNTEPKYTEAEVRDAFEYLDLSLTKYYERVTVDKIFELLKAKQSQGSNELLDRLSADTQEYINKEAKQ